MIAEGAFAFDRVIKGALNGIKNNAYQGRSLLRNQGNRYRVSWCGFDEGEGAVQRINTPKGVFVVTTFIVRAFFCEESEIEALETGFKRFED